MIYRLYFNPIGKTVVAMETQDPIKAARFYVDCVNCKTSVRMDIQEDCFNFSLLIHEADTISNAFEWMSRNVKRTLSFRVPKYEEMIIDCLKNDRENLKERSKKFISEVRHNL